MALGNRIYDFRKKAGLTRDDVAKKCSVSSQSVQKWESDHAKTSVDNLKYSRRYSMFRSMNC